MTPNYRGWLWSLVAVAGTATAAVVVYKYATRGVRDQGESDAHAAAATEEGEDVGYEWSSEDEEEAEEQQQSEQQLLAVDRGRNMVRRWRIYCCAVTAGSLTSAGRGAAGIGSVRTHADGAGDRRVAGRHLEQ
ncbi:unnamed protein product [Phytophthora fragariaefolia]|uniref:Unnamed protein product n=1 Tax=Phytophthora fragariaefolia TaxID=1490495 RepID=A0A9W6YNT0_9STRA|nr:unnamed protein product [Phytophthora fragariaefolia]